MIEWKSYANGLHTDSHKMFLLTDGEKIYTGYHASTTNGYMWFEGNHVHIARITHYAEINLPTS